MKVIIVNAHISDQLGGSEMQCDLIAKGLTQTGHQVLYAAVGKNRKNQYEGSSYRIEPLDLTNKKEIKSMLTQFGPDIIYWRFNKNHLKAIMELKQELDIPFVFGVSSKRDTQKYAYAERKGLNPIKKWAYYLKHMRSSAIGFNLIKNADAVTVLNSQYLNKLPVKKQRTVWNAASVVAEPFNWPKPFVLWVANLKAIKRPEVFMHLARKFKEQQPEVDFIMIGDLKEKVPYQSMIDEAKTLPNFHYLGKKSPEFVNGAFASAYCMVHTCKPEGFGNNFIQAWLQGCPTLTLDHDPDGLIAKEKLGFASGTTEQITQDLKKLLNDPELRDEQSKKASKFSHEYFLPEKLTTRMTEFLEEVLEANRTGS